MCSTHIQSLAENHRHRLRHLFARFPTIPSDSSFARENTLRGASEPYALPQRREIARVALPFSWQTFLRTARRKGPLYPSIWCSGRWPTEKMDGGITAREKGTYFLAIDSTSPLDF